MKNVDFFGETAAFHHLGLAVPSIAAAHPDLDPVYDLEQKVRIAFIRANGMTIELLEPVGEDSPVLASLRKDARLLHLCYEVENLPAALAAGRRNGFHPLAAPVPATAFGGRKIAWVFSPVYGLFELLEKER